MAIINIREYMNGHIEANLSLRFSKVVIAGCLLEIICISIFLYCNRNKLSKKINKNKCGYIYSDLRYKIWGSLTLCYPIVSQIRLVVIAVVTIYMMRMIVVQTLAIAISSIFVMSLAGFVRPFKKSFVQLLDEYVALIVLDLLFFSTDPNLNPYIRLHIGWQLIAILGLSIAFNQGSLLVKSVLRLRRVCRFKWHRYQKKKAKQAKKKARKVKESQVDREKIPVPRELVEEEKDDLITTRGSRASRVRMIPAEKRRKDRDHRKIKLRTSGQARYEDTTIGTGDLNGSSLINVSPTPKINETANDSIIFPKESGKSNLIGKRDLDAAEPVFEVECRWCRIRDDGSKCLDCEWKDTDRVISSRRPMFKTYNSALEPEQEQHDQASIAELENEIEQSERHSQRILSSRVFDQGNER